MFFRESVAKPSGILKAKPLNFLPNGLFTKDVTLCIYLKVVNRHGTIYPDNPKLNISLSTRQQP